MLQDFVVLHDHRIASLHDRLHRLRVASRRNHLGVAEGSRFGSLENALEFQALPAKSVQDFLAAVQDTHHIDCYRPLLFAIQIIQVQRSKKWMVNECAGRSFGTSSRCLTPDPCRREPSLQGGPWRFSLVVDVNKASIQFRVESFTCELSVPFCLLGFKWENQACIWASLSMAEVQFWLKMRRELPHRKCESVPFSDVTWCFVVLVRNWMRD